jgi:hypothetical protein
MSIKAAGKEYKVLFSPHRRCTPTPRSYAPQAFIDQLSAQLSSDVARLIKELKTQAEEAIREAEKFDKIRSDFAGTVQKIEVVFPLQFPLAICSFYFVVIHAVAQTTTVKAQGKKDAMTTFQHVNGVMEDFEANKVAPLPCNPPAHPFPAHFS